LRTAYGDLLCEDCWDDYICTDAGRLEYLIGICYGDLPMSEFDADFLGSVAKSWKEHSQALALTPSQRLVIEDKAIKLGIL
jgi:hypothetical protein